MGIKLYKQFIAHTALFLALVLFLYLDSFALWLHQIPGGGEDGLKNFFTLAYHIQHGSSWLWFNGMNYPFGEHIIYTDNQPLIAMFLKFLNLFLPVEGSTHIVLPLLLIISFMIGSWMLFLVMKRSNLPVWFAMISAVGIILLSPQWIRLSGHYSLAHGFIIPTIIYLLLRWHEGSPGMARYLIGITFISGLIHPYFLLMCVLLIGLFMGIHLLSRARNISLKHWLLTLAIPIIPLLLFQTFLWLTDPVSDRPDAPYGYLIYRATLASVLIPMYADYGDWVFNLFPDFKEAAGEGSFYIGFVAVAGGTIALCIYLINLGREFWMKRKIKLGFELTLILASIPILLLAIGLPFSLERFEFLMDYMGPLKQFRGIGRFSFVFFYVANLFAFIGIWKLSLHRKTLKVIAIMALIIIATESYRYSHHIIESTSHGSDELVENEWPALTNETYQAILPLPFYHIGSENFRTTGAMPIIPASMALSQKNGIPLIATQLSRTSLEQTLSLIGLTTEQIHPNALASKHADESWVLMVDVSAKIPPHQLTMIEVADFIGNFRGYNLYKFQPSEYKYLYAEQLKNIKEVTNFNSTLSIDASSLESDSVMYFSFDASEGAYAYQGESGISVERKEWTHLIPKNQPLRSVGPYELSFWIKLNDQHAINTQVWFWERDGEEELEFKVTEIGDHISAIDGDWGLCSYTFLPKKPGNQFEILLHREDEPMEIWVDELLLRPLATNVVKKGTLNLNNRYYKPIADVGVI